MRTYMSVRVGNVVGQFALVKGDGGSIHPLLARRRGIGMNVETRRELGIGLSRHHPTRVVILVTAGHTKYDI